eukprot:Nk52_evm17s1837 gene=Nk52_evmTU17s1837
MVEDFIEGDAEFTELPDQSFDDGGFSIDDDTPATGDASVTAPAASEAVNNKSSPLKSSAVSPSRKAGTRSDDEEEEEEEELDQDVAAAQLAKSRNQGMMMNQQGRPPHMGRPQQFQQNQMGRGGYNNNQGQYNNNNNRYNNRGGNNNNNRRNNNYGNQKYGNKNQNQQQMQQQQSGPYVLNDVVRNFILYFHKNVVEQNVYEIHSIYENHFNKLTERYFKNQPWPPVESIARLVDSNPLFLTLYKELYYRHIYSKMQPTLQQRFESYENYCELFNYILNAQQPVSLDLPNQWLWDITDEFIYQFQSFCQFRSKLKSKSEEELKMLKENPQVWNVHSVLNVLHSLVEKSRVNEQLDMYRNSEDPTGCLDDFADRTLYKMLGYFSLIGLCRLHCLLGDYTQALKVICHIDPARKGLYARVPSCQITLYYYMGFAYLMMRRYEDAIRTFMSILLYIQRTKQYHTRSYQYDQILKKNEQMYALLAMTVTLCPQRIDESVHAVLREKLYDKLMRMQKGDESAFEELFQFACPKFVLPVPVPMDAPLANHNQEAYRVQMRLFLNEVHQQAFLPTVRSYLKLYTTMPVEKLAGFLNMSKEQFLTHLLLFKHKTRNLVWLGEGSPSNGEPHSSSDVDFYIVGDMIHIGDTKVARKYGEYFVRQINKFDDVCNAITKRGQQQQQGGNSSGMRKGSSSHHQGQEKEGVLAHIDDDTPATGDASVTAPAASEAVNNKSSPLKSSAVSPSRKAGTRSDDEEEEEEEELDQDVAAAQLAKSRNQGMMMNQQGRPPHMGRPQQFQQNQMGRGGYNNNQGQYNNNNNRYNNRGGNNNNNRRNNNYGNQKYGNKNQNQQQMQQQQSGPYVLNDVVRNFILYFHKNVVEQNVYEIHSIYENHFNKLTERYFKNQPWPPVESIARLVDSNPLFLTLYKELYYRHIYSKMQPTLQQRFESYENYCELFNYILNAQQPVSLDLPNQWLWDITDEFIYQFQSFCQFRSKLKSKSEEELKMLKENPQVWNVHSVLNVLHSLVEKSRVNEQLDMYRNSEDPTGCLDDFADRTLYKMLGYFSLIGLCRLHCLLGDYTQALKVICHIDPARKGLYARVPSCQITLYYYMGFAYLMMRRYEDAIRTFMSILLYIQRTKQYHTRSYQYDQILKKNEQMYALLAMTVTLCPQRIDESVHAVLREKLYDKLMRMQKGDESAFEELFQFACPKFVLPVPVPMDAPLANHNQEAYRVQMRLFLNEVHQQAFLPTVRSYLKLYTTMPVEKLAGFLNMSKEQFLTHLLLFKHKTRNLKIGRFVKAFVSIAHMLESTLFAAYNSYRAIKSVGSQLATLRSNMRGMLRAKLGALWWVVGLVVRFLRVLGVDVEEAWRGVGWRGSSLSSMGVLQDQEEEEEHED